MRGLFGRIALGAALASLALTQALGQSPAFEPVTDAMIRDPDPKDWLSWRRTLDSWGYSPLGEIDRGNVGGLRMVWSRPQARSAGTTPSPPAPRSVRPRRAIG